MGSFRVQGVAGGADELEKDPSPRGADSTAAGSACSDNAAATPLWTLIWCHERCHKQECQWKRSVIGDTAQGAGAALVCLKKAAKFETWMEQADHPFGLLTDWREVKPCLQAAEAQPQGMRPAFTVVYCELPKHHERASAWARTLPEWHAPVRILGDLGLLKACLGDLAGFLSEAALRRRTGAAALPAAVAASNACLASNMPGFRSAPPGRHFLWSSAEDEEEALEARYERMRKERDSMWLAACWTGAPAAQQAPEQQQQQQPWGAVGTPNGVVIRQFQEFQPMQPQSPVHGPQTPVGCVYVGPAPCAEPPQAGDHMETTVEQMLRKAMPDHYDD